MINLNHRRVLTVNTETQCSRIALTSNNF